MTQVLPTVWLVRHTGTAWTLRDPTLCVPPVGSWVHHDLTEPLIHVLNDLGTAIAVVPRARLNGKSQ